jgi:Tfp pilus assembly protein PilX
MIMKKITLLILVAVMTLFTACGEDSKKPASEATAKTIDKAPTLDEAEEAMKRAAEITQKVAEEKAEEMAEAAKSVADDASDTAKDALENAKAVIHDATAPDKE